MERRRFIGLLGGTAIASAVPLSQPLQAQQSERVIRIAVLIPYAENDPQAQAEVAALREKLQQLGWAEGSRARIDIRWAAGDVRRIQTHAKELVALKPDVIFSRTTPATAALLQETRTIPIVFTGVSDPVGAGFAASMARPGGSATGFTNVEASLGGKWVEVLKEISPRLTRIAVMFGAKTSPEGGAFYMRMIQNAARSIAATTVAVPVEDPATIDRAFSELTREPGTGLIVQPDVTTNAYRASIIALAAKARVPAVYPFCFYASEGGLAAYGINPIDVYRQAAVYIDRIIRGEKPSELPVQGPVKFDLCVNVKTAKALGLELPAMLLGRADDVIE